MASTRIGTLWWSWVVVAGCAGDPVEGGGRVDGSGDDDPAGADDAQTGGSPSIPVGDDSDATGSDSLGDGSTSGPASDTEATNDSDDPETSVGETSVGETSVGETSVGETSVGETSVGETSVGETSVGETSVGETSVGETSVGETSVGETSVGETSGGETSVGETSVGETSGGETSGGETSVGETSVGETSVGETSVGETSVGEASAGETSVGETSVGETSVGETTEAETTAAESTDSGVTTSDGTDTESTGGEESSTGDPGGIDIVVEDDVLFDDARRFGINLGGLYQYGESNLLKNVIPNPGFEAGEFGTVFVVEQGATPNLVQARYFNTATQPNEHPVGFWNGAPFELLLGPADGRTGTITSFTHQDDRYTFELDGEGAAPLLNDILLVHRQVPGFDAAVTGSFAAETDETRPLSEGTQSLRLLPAANASYQLTLDSHYRDGDTSAPKLLLVEGTWHFEVWARADEPGDTLSIWFGRGGGQGPFLSTTEALDDEWQLIERDFVVPPGFDAQVGPGAPHPAIQFNLRANLGEVIVDDMVLERADDDSPTAFDGGLVQALRELRPGILRDWGSQLGSSLDNELASEFARHTTGYRLTSPRAFNWHYSLVDFLELCAEVGADPWYVIPPTWSEAEIENFIAYLGAPAGEHPYADLRASQGRLEPWTDVFQTIHLELSNETWASGDPAVDPYAGATLGGGVNEARITSARFAVMRASPWFVPERFDLALGGQARFTGRQQQLVDNSTEHDSVGVAPYYGDLDDTSGLAPLFLPLYAHATQSVTSGNMVVNHDILSAAQTRMAIYELNVHTVDDGPGAMRNEVLTSQGASISLPLVMLTYLREWQVRDQMAFKALQYSHLRSNAWVRAFGMLRDIRAGGLRRPTWLGLEIVNDVMGPELLSAYVEGDVPIWTQPAGNGITAPIDVEQVQAFAFRDGDRYGLVLFNLSLDQAHEVRLLVPEPMSTQAVVERLGAADPRDDNETTLMVAIETEALDDFTNDYPLVLDPHSITTVRWE